MTLRPIILSVLCASALGADMPPLPVVSKTIRHKPIELSQGSGAKLLLSVKQSITQRTNIVYAVNSALPPNCIFQWRMLKTNQVATPSINWPLLVETTNNMITNTIDKTCVCCWITCNCSNVLTHEVSYCATK